MQVRLRPFTSKKREPTGKHKFDVRSKALNIEHRLSPARHPQTNGMVARFNGSISGVVGQTRFASAAELEASLTHYVKSYKHQIPQRALNHLSPVQALKKWRTERPESFVRRVYNRPGLDTPPRPNHALRRPCQARRPMPAASAAANIMYVAGSGTTVMAAPEFS